MDINRGYMPNVPNIPNSHAVLERIAKNQVAAHEQLMEGVAEIAELLRSQNELLQKLLVLQRGKE